MKSKIIYDFQEFEEKMKDIISKSKNNKNLVEEVYNKWKTECGLPIKHYRIGKGKKHIVFFGSFHGSEIISTEFLIYLMDEIVNNEIEFNEILEKYTLDFLPIVNPEGYVITTSAIRKLIPSNASLQEIENICNKYLTAYKKDDDDEIELSNNNRKSNHVDIKKYQQMFKDVTYMDIPDKYIKVKEKLKELYFTYDIPKGTMISWSSNANGIDLNANIKYNKTISKIEQGERLYMKLRYSNIDYSHPGPINCPYDKSKGFFQEKEVEYISKFLEDLFQEGKLVAIFNFHSVGAIIDQRPSEVPEDIKDRKINLKHKSLNNYLFAKFYQSETYKDLRYKDIKYDILKDGSEVRTVNGLYRVLYPLDMLVELSVIGGNPLGPFSNIEINYNSVMKSNLEAVKKSVKYLEVSNKIADSINSYMEKNYKELDKEEFINKGYSLIDEIFEKIHQYIKKGEGENNIIKHINNELNSNKFDYGFFDVELLLDKKV